MGLFCNTGLHMLGAAAPVCIIPVFRLFGCPFLRDCNPYHIPSRKTQPIPPPRQNPCSIPHQLTDRYRIQPNLQADVSLPRDVERGSRGYEPEGGTRCALPVCNIGWHCETKELRPGQYAGGEVGPTAVETNY